MTDSIGGTATRSLAINIIPKLDKDKFVQQIRDLLSSIGIGGIGSRDNSGDKAFEELNKQVQDLAETVKGLKAGLENTQRQVKDESDDSSKGINGTGAQVGDIKTPLEKKEIKVADSKDNTKDLAEKKNKKESEKGEPQKKTLKGALESSTFKALYRTVSKVANVATTGLKRGFGILQSLYNRVKQSSQFLAAVENMFNLAMTLLLLPFGNALATVILPSMIELVDGVLGLWDDMDDVFDGTSGTLGKILDIVLDKGLDKFGEFFNGIGDKLEDSGGLLGAIGEMMNFVGGVLKDGVEPILSAIFTILSTVMKNFKEFISIYVAYQTAMLGAQMGAGLGPFGSLIGGSIGMSVGGLGTYSYLTGIGLAEGDYVPATAGGSLRVIGEAGEGEYIIPESKMRSQSSGTIINNFYGYTETELKQIVRDTLREEVQNSSYTGII